MNTDMPQDTPFIPAPRITTVAGYLLTRAAEAGLISIFGVGELSAMNALAGAYTESVPVVHIVGTAATAPEEIDRVLSTALRTSRPVYLTIPADLADIPVLAPVGRLPASLGAGRS